MNMSTLLTAGVAALVVLMSIGCKDLSGTPGLPAGTPNPAYYDDSSGAVGLRNGTISRMGGSIPAYLVDAGLLTDELEDEGYHASAGTLLSNGNVIVDPLDERILPEGTYGGTISYGNLQGVRAYANLALHALALYDTAPGVRATQRVLRSELYAMSGYAEILLSDLFCSGVPLSTLDFHQDFTYAPSSRWNQVYQHASVLLDSALQLSPANDSVLNLARVLKGRAQLALGRYAAAADDVALVPNAFQYRLTFKTGPDFTSNYITHTPYGGATVADREGGTGLPYRSSGDPRTTTTVVCLPGSYNCSASDTLMIPTKYAGGTYVPFVVANGIEARLIEAEAALQANSSSAQWLTILNALRTTGTQDTVPTETLVDTLGYTGCTVVGACDAKGFQVSVDYTHLVLLDSTTVTMSGAAYRACPTLNPTGTFDCRNPTVYVYRVSFVVMAHPGTGGVSGLVPLSDPGALLTDANAQLAARIAVLFRERAYWLFLTGHRQGDLRRLLRQYGQYAAFHSQAQVYPSGIYPAPGNGLYGQDFTVPIPTAEYTNPNYHGCLNRDDH